MAFKTLQVPSSLARPNAYSFSPSHSSYQTKPPSSSQARVAAKNHLSSPPVLKCRANLHGCVDEVVQSQQLDHQTTEIPIVQYPSVVFPGETLQLQTFEFRYRIMMHTLLQETLTFGIIYSGRKDSRMDDVGCMVHVVECEKLVDDRFFLTCVGGDRFRVLEVVRTKPYVIARIQVFTDRCSLNAGHQVDLGCLMQQVERHLKNVTMLSDKLNWKRTQPGQLSKMHSPESFSFTVARLFIDDRSEQQWLLRLDDTAQRLVREGRYLEQRSKYLAAIAAIRDAFHHLSCDEKY
uniref:Uncharacterized protein n=1 Tax=Avena sativa TaxID=4498 RepID=A0ACD5YKX4_AVESA